MANIGGITPPKLVVKGIPSAWGDFAEQTEPLTGNLFGVFIEVPKSVKDLQTMAATLISMLASGVVLPSEAVMIEEVATKLSSYDVVVGKERGELSITFKEQVGAPVAQIMSAWHKTIVDGRRNGIGFPADYATRIWVAALAGNGAPYYWWMFTRSFPKQRGNNFTFGNDQKTPVEVEVPFSYLEMFDGADALAAAGSAMVTKLSAAAKAIGFGA